MKDHQRASNLWIAVATIAGVASFTMCSPDSNQSRSRSEGVAVVAEYTAPVRPTSHEFRAATESWRWLVPESAQVLLVTSLGDVFVQDPNGSVRFLDTESGELTNAARSVDEWQEMLQRPENVERWFRPSFVRQLRLQQPLKMGDVYSPTIPLVLGGKLSAENYTPSFWQAHLHVMGQIHYQVKDLPPGTPITKIHVEPY